MIKSLQVIHSLYLHNIILYYIILYYIILYYIILYYIILYYIIIGAVFYCSSNNIKYQRNNLKKKEKVIGTYVSVIFSDTSNKKIDDMLKELNLKKDFNDAYHCTLVYTKPALPYFKTNNGTKQKDYRASQKLSKIAKIKGFGHFDTPEGKNLHIILDCKFCESEFNRAMSQGANFDYDKYTPHVTLMYNCTKDNKYFNIDDKDTKKFIGTTLEIIEELIEPLNENWVEDSQNDNKDDNTNK